MSSEMQKISVAIYGGKPVFGGGRERPLVAEVTYCDAADECPLKRQGKCLKAERLGSCHCPHAMVSGFKGYTSRAKKYKEFADTWRNDPLLNALKCPSGPVVIFEVCGRVFMKLGHMKLEYNEQQSDWLEGYNRVGKSNIWTTRDAWRDRAYLWVPREEVNAEVISEICHRYTYALMGGRIDEWNEKQVPMVVDQLKANLPDVYADLCELDPELVGRPMNHVGRYAKALTLRDGSELKDCHGNVFRKEGGELVCDDYNSSLVGPQTIMARGATLTLNLSERDTVKVESNDWVTDTTEFL
jgi:hypothetical protein